MVLIIYDDICYARKRNYKVAFCNIMNYCNKGILLFYKPKCLLFIVLIISVLQK